MRTVQIFPQNKNKINTERENIWNSNSYWLNLLETSSKNWKESMIIFKTNKQKPKTNQPKNPKKKTQTIKKNPNPKLTPKTISILHYQNSYSSIDRNSKSNNKIHLWTIWKKFSRNYTAFSHTFYHNWKGSLIDFLIQRVLKQ